MLSPRLLGKRLQDAVRVAFPVVPGCVVELDADDAGVVGDLFELGTDAFGDRDVTIVMRREDAYGFFAGQSFLVDGLPAFAGLFCACSRRTFGRRRRVGQSRC
jgi:hypothetical protein